MKGKLLYSLSVLLLGTIIFLYILSQQEQRSYSKQNTKNASSSKVELSKPSLPNTKKSVLPNKFSIKDLEGEYWNHPYIKEHTEMSDVCLNLSFNDQNQLVARSLYYESVPVEEGKEEWGVQREGPMTSLSPFSDTVLIIDDPIDFLDGDFLYIIKTANQIGLSLDGKKIAYYMHQHIMPELSDQALLNHFHGSPEEGHVVTVGRKEHFTESGTDYTLVFFEEHFSELYGFRNGGNSSYLSLAKFKKGPSGMHHLVTFLGSCSCGYYQDVHSSNEIMIYPTLQKIGHKHFLLKKTPTKEDALSKTVLQVYDVDEFEEILSIDLESYKVNSLGEKEYVQKKSFSFAEEDCAIIIQEDPIAGEQTQFQLKQNIYLFEDENNAFVKVD
jgi:hypothetical protein